MLSPVWARVSDFDVSNWQSKFRAKSEIRFVRIRLKSSKFKLGFCLCVYRVLVLSMQLRHIHPKLYGSICQQINLFARIGSELIGMKVPSA